MFFFSFISNGTFTLLDQQRLSLDVSSSKCEPTGLMLLCFTIIIKRPTRDACLCMGELQAPPALPAPAAPHFVFLITLFGGFFSNLAGLGSSLGEFFLICCSDISTNQRGHMTKNVSFRGGSLSG